MTSNENYTDDDFLEDDDATDIRSLRKAANAARKLKAEVTQMKRELAFAKAGLPLDDPRMSYFVKGYEGEMDAEAIREAAISSGFLAPVQSDTDTARQAQTQAAAAVQQRVMAASAGSTAEDISEAAAIGRMEAAMEEGGLEAMLDVARQYGIPTNTEY